MSEEQKLTLQEFHRAFAPGLFNKTWDLLEKSDRTAEDDETMILIAHASLYHWTKVDGYTPLHHVRGLWMIAHVYTILEWKDAALTYARRCLDETLENGFEDFDLGYAHEGMARALALVGRSEEAQEELGRARAVAETIAKAGDRKQFTADLDSGPWFGI